MRLILTASLAAIALSGCATSAAGLYRSKVEKTFTSEKAPQSVATCAVENLKHNTQIRNDGEHYWVMRYNGYNIPQIRWDFLPRAGGGTTIELRTSIDIMAGDEVIKACL